MKLQNHPLFLILSLCLFFPIGIILLIHSDCEKKRKTLFAAVGLLLFLLLLSCAFFAIPKSQEMHSQIIIKPTQTTLNIGQSGGFSVYMNKRIITDFTIEKSNQNLDIINNVYTAVHPGQTTITVSADGATQSFVVTICDEKRTDTIVYLSISGKKYHKNQSHAGKNACAMTEEEAIRCNKTPCKICYE